MLELPETMTLGGMGGPIDRVSSEYNAIAYSVYFYEQYMDRRERNKLIGINGVAPTAETIASRKYPLSTEVYVVIRTDAAADAPTRRLRDWLLDKHGQAIVKESGYVPINEVRPFQGAGSDLMTSPPATPPR